MNRTDTMTGMDAFRVNTADSVAVALRDLSPGEKVRIDDKVLVPSLAIARGHKVALCPVREGEP
ncbi:MAG TPA: hypothetical protein DF715_01050, partial [Oceanicaulis sp.]|nr:hypothetical protein [Oceanicaulis sp.]